MDKDLSSLSAKRKFHIAKAWKLKGDMSSALSAFEEAVELDPDFAPARIGLADLLLDMGEISKSLAHYDHAIDLDPENPKTAFRRQYLKKLKTSRKRGQAESRADIEIKSGGFGKIRFMSQKTFACHRGGWDSAIASLRTFHNRKGVLFDTFLENNFAWKHWKEGVRDSSVLKKLMHEGGFDDLATSEEKGITPYQEPWVGIFHNPHNMPDWFHYQESPQSIFKKDIWKRSMPFCRGLFCLSEYQAVWLRSQVECPVSVLVHPAEIPRDQFDFDRFIRNPEKKIVQIGWWLRKLSSIYRMPILKGNRMGFRKARLVPKFFDDADNYLKELIKREKRELKLEPYVDGNTVDIQNHIVR